MNFDPQAPSVTPSPPKAHRTPSEEKQAVLAGGLRVDPGTYLDKEVSNEFAKELRQKLNSWIMRNQGALADVKDNQGQPAFKSGIPLNNLDKNFIVDNNFAIAVSRFQKANKLEATGSIDAATLKLLDAIKPATLPQLGPMEKLGLHRVGASPFFSAGGIFVELKSNGEVKFFQQAKNVLNQQPGAINGVSLATLGTNEFRSVRLVTRSGSGNFTNVRAYSVEGWGGTIEKSTIEKGTSINFPPGGITSQLQESGFSETTPGVYRRTLADREGKQHELVALMANNSVRTILLPVKGSEDIAVRTADLSPITTRPHEKYRSLAVTVLPFKSAGKTLALQETLGSVELKQ